ncbi:hypothetical protein HMSSN139_39780 [Paenibacillus sp. HMSSN-139]|nr:hypothetical protein HMSSN139_39780 [Paenibacillus sp. HMSSN-139]
MSDEKEQWLEDLIRLTEEEDTEKKTEKQIKILEAATEIFAEKGYAATSTSEIAQRPEWPKERFSVTIRRRKICFCPSPDRSSSSWLRRSCCGTSPR